MYLGMTLLTRDFFGASTRELGVKILSRDVTGLGGMEGGSEQELFLFFIISVCLMIGCSIAVWWSAKMAVQIVVFHLSALPGAPILMMVTSFFAGEEMQQSICSFLPVFWGLIIGYVLVLLVIQRVWQDFRKNKISGSGGNHRQRPDRFNRLVYDGAADHAGSAGYYIYHVH